MNIGDITLKNGIVLAPMAGVTDLPFRLLCKQMGADIVYTEFCSSNGIIRESKKTFDLIKFIEEERPIGVQIFGEEPHVVGESAKIIYDRFKPDIIDINFGCPVPKVTKKGAGSAALKNLSVMEEMVKSVIKNVPEIPITVKMRSGWSKDKIVHIEAAIMLEELGIKAITLHPRTTCQRFTGNADWDEIKRLKSKINIPVIGNGDVSNKNDYMKIKKHTNCDGVMIGRASLGNPWIFKELTDDNYNSLDRNIMDIVDICEKHFILLKKYKEERVCLNLTKKHFSWYLKGFNNASEWRKKFLKSKSIDDVVIALDEMKDSYYS